GASCTRQRTGSTAANLSRRGASKFPVGSVPRRNSARRHPVDGLGTDRFCRDWPASTFSDTPPRYPASPVGADGIGSRTVGRKSGVLPFFSTLTLCWFSSI